MLNNYNVRFALRHVGIVFSCMFFFLMSMRTEAQVANYQVATSAGTYTSVTGGTVLGTTTSDDQSFNNNTAGATGTVTNTGFAIGFNFVYNGVSYDKFAVNNNGWMLLGTGTFSIANSYVPMSVAGPANFVNAIAAFGRDLQGQTGSSLRYELIGTSPNQTLVVQWETTGSSMLQATISISRSV